MVNYRLTETMESRIHRKVYVRFGGEYPETRHRNMKMGVGYLAYISYVNAVLCLVGCHPSVEFSSNNALIPSPYSSFEQE